jgi:hypothetical protein
LYLTGAQRTINYPEDRFQQTSLDRAPVSATSDAWATTRELAAQGNATAQAIVKIGTAINAKRFADAEGTEVPAWALSTLQFMDCYQTDQTDDLDEALAALSAAL